MEEEDTYTRTSSDRMYRERVSEREEERDREWREGREGERASERDRERDSGWDIVDRRGGEWGEKLTRQTSPTLRYR